MAIVYLHVFRPVIEQRTYKVPFKCALLLKVNQFRVLFFPPKLDRKTLQDTFRTPLRRRPIEATCV